MLAVAMLLALATSTPDPLLPRQWDDADEVTTSIATGSVEVCDVVATPLGLVPEFGTVLEIAMEWLCLVPGAISADYVQRQHGDRDGRLWQGFLGLAVGKLWRDATRILVAGGVTAIALAAVALFAISSGALALTVWPVAPLFLPLVAAAAITAAAGAYVAIREVRKSVQEALFKLIYSRITPRFDDEPTQRKAQRDAIIRPRLNVVERAWLLASVAAGADPEFSPLHLVPVAGPIVKARHKADAVQDLLRRVSSEELRETRSSWALVDAGVDVVIGAEGLLGAMTHIALIAAVATLVVGGVLALVQIPLGFTQPRQALPDRDQWLSTVARAGPLALITGFLGVVALGLVGTAVVFIAAREVPKLLTPVVIPVLYGLKPPGPLFPTRGRYEDPEEKALPPPAPPEDDWPPPEKPEVFNPAPVEETPAPVENPAPAAPEPAQPEAPEAPAPPAPTENQS